MNSKELQKTMQNLDIQRERLFDIMIAMAKKGDDFTQITQAWQSVDDAQKEFKLLKASRKDIKW